MKNLFSCLSILVGFTFLFSSCDKIDNPYEKADIMELDSTLFPGNWVQLDTAIFPGNWADYAENDYPVFTENTNTDVNVLVEDYTGHLCSNCPLAADEAHSIHQAHPNRVFIASIHVDPNAQLGFQASFPENPKYFTDFTNPDGIAYGETFGSGFNFLGNPSGTVNRKTVGGKMFDSQGTWQSRADAILSANNLKVNIQSVFNYFESTGGGFLHTEFEKKVNDPLKLNAVVYVIEDSLITWQTMPDNSDNEFYVHRDIHLGSIDNHPWGVNVFDTDAKAGDKAVLDYSYMLPTDIDKENLHFLIYIYDVDTYEILQVIKQEIN